MRYLLTIAFLGFFTINSNAQDTTAVRTIKNLDAKSKTSFFSLVTGKEVKESEPWDMAFNATTIKLNSKADLKNKVAVATLKGTSFEKVSSIPASGFQEDTQSTSGIPTGSGNGWYTYDMGTHQVLPIADRVFVVKTTSGTYFKLAVLSYYFDGNESEETGYYTFKYVGLK